MYSDIDVKSLSIITLVFWQNSVWLLFLIFNAKINHCVQWNYLEQSLDVIIFLIKFGIPNIWLNKIKSSISLNHYDTGSGYYITFKAMIHCCIHKNDFELNFGVIISFLIGNHMKIIVFIV